MKKKIGWSIMIVLFITVLCNVLVSQWNRKHVYDSVNEVPYNRVGLLLGTGKYMRNGVVNLYYKYRINAAVRLFKAGKIEYVLISGDNGHKDYDEPSTMKQDLIQNGVPADRIVLDYAGFRTLDSVVRSQKVFGQKSLTIISQRFHNERAIYIARFKGINAVGYNAKDVGQRMGLKTKAREILARVKVNIDLLFGVKPKFLGETIKI